MGHVTAQLPLSGQSSNGHGLDQALLNFVEAQWRFDDKKRLVSWSDSGNGPYAKLSKELAVGTSYQEFLEFLINHGSITKLSNSENANESPGFLTTGRNEIDELEGFLHNLESGQLLMIKHTVFDDGHLLFAAFDITQFKAEQQTLLGRDAKLLDFARISSDWSWELDSNLRYVYHTSHKPSPSGTEVAKLTGMTRMDHVSPFTDKNDQLIEHNEKLMAHERLDLILSWTSAGISTHSHIIAEPQYHSDGTFKGYLGCGRDVTRYHEAQQQLEHQANHDDLTGLLNRRAFTAHLNSVIEKTVDRNASESSENIALITFDLDRFKLVNDQAGHIAGDKLLVEITAITQSLFDDKATLARLGGDEFAILLICEEQLALKMVRRLINQLADYRFIWNNRNFTIGASAGIAFMDDSIKSSSELLSHSDIACYSAKQGGRNQVQTYSEQNSFQMQINQELEKLQQLRFAHDNDRLVLFFQPIVADISGARPDRFEALLRMRDEQDNWISPGEFIPIAEKFDMMPVVDYWVVDEAIKQLKAFSDRGSSISLSINLSGNTLSNATCLARITDLVKSSDIDSHSLCFEITETAAIRELNTVSSFMRELRALGCAFALDDFGSGLSSYGYLKSLSLDYLKIDGSFVRNIDSDHTSAAIVKSFITLSHEMGLKTVAEFVENMEIANVLRDMNVDYMQGYAFGRPQNVQDWLDLLDEDIKLTGT